MAFKYIIGDTETDKATEASLLDGNGPYTHTVALGATGGVNWLHIIPGDPNPYVHFFGTYNSTSNPTHNDNVFHIGHNVNAGGGAVEAGKGVLSDAWESYFNGGHIQQERHLKWVDVDGYETRFISFEGHLDDGSTDLFIDSTNIRLGSGRNANTPPSVSIAPAITIISSPDGYNNALFDQDAGGYVRLSAGSPSNGQDRASVQVSANGQASITTRFIGTIQDATASQPQYYWDANNTVIQSPDAISAKMVISNGTGPIFYVNGVAGLLIQSNQIFVNNKLLYVQFDNVQTNTRGDLYGAALFRNNTNATSGVPEQYSPPHVLAGNAWNGSSAQPTYWETQVKNISGATPISTFAWAYSSDGANYTEKMSLSNSGELSPSVDGTQSFGSTSKRWKDGYFNGTVTFDGYAKMAATVGILTSGPNLQGVDSTSSNFMKYTPSDSGTTSWYQWAGSFANGGGRRNQVMRFGWNVNGGGSRVDTGANNGVLASEYEQYFEGGHNQMERHETFVDTDGYQTRWLSFEGHLDDGTTALYVRATVIDVGSGKDSNDQSQLLINATTTRVMSPNNFNYLYADNDQMWLQAGTSATANTKITQYPNGDLYFMATRGFITGATGNTLAKWTNTSSELISPDGYVECYVDNNGIDLITGGASSLEILSSELKAYKNITSATHNSVDIGASANRFRDGYLVNITATDGYFDNVSIDGYNINPYGAMTGQALVYNGSAYVATKIGGTYNVTSIKTSTYVAVDKDLVQCDPSGGGFTVTLPAVSTSLTVVVKNITNSTNTITINPDGTDTIDGASSTSIVTAYGVITFYSDAGTNWIVI